MALLGVLISNIFSSRRDKKEREWERYSNLQSKKEELYIKIIRDLNIPSITNQFITSQTSLDIVGKENYDIEASLQLYASSDIVFKYHSAHEAYEADLPYQEKEIRYSVLLYAIRKDLGIENGK